MVDPSTSTIFISQPTPILSLPYAFRTLLSWLEMCLGISRGNKTESKVEYNCYKRRKALTVQLEQIESEFEKLCNYYLGGRKVYVHNLRLVLLVEELTLLGNVRFRINELDNTYCHFEASLPFIDPISFPLNEIKTSSENIDDLHHPSFVSAKNLIFDVEYDEDDQSVPENVYKIQNKKVLFDHFVMETSSVKKFIKYWKDVGKEIGTTFEFINKNVGYGSNYYILSALRKEFGKFQKELIGVDKRMIPSFASYSIPLGYTSKILVYGTITSLSAEPCEKRLVMKVVPATELHS
ncbi:hypothetical protein GCK72_008018 [Caenorhabditis remanei]|uniref:F-box associated domain-containing protein n=1 Tax=Caenorhabditis remanei TaxID=31234 RepID=A0A6A5HP18_CAERE|nr:hypothetical protein GCK72_008018 [Caenorhabditis remanei]KAF1768057.1 hypothetical protein GCK72_008018 [Caenorhabditis remanei]